MDRWPLPTTENAPFKRTPFAHAHGYAPLAMANASRLLGWRKHTLAAGVPLNYETLAASCDHPR